MVKVEFAGFPEGLKPGDEKVRYWLEVEEKEAADKGERLERLKIRYVSETEWGFTPVYAARPFHRIRRITGYLSATDRWNEGKTSELIDRVAHSLS